MGDNQLNDDIQAAQELIVKTWNEGFEAGKAAQFSASILREIARLVGFNLTYPITDEVGKRLVNAVYRKLNEQEAKGRRAAADAVVGAFRTTVEELI